MDPIAIPGAALTAVGAYLTLSTITDLRRGRASERWPRATGRVVSLGAHPGSLQRGDSAAAVAYEYEVAGRAYRSNRYDFAGRNAGAGAGRVLVRFQVGDAVDVRYDPSDPGRSVLEAGITAGNRVRVAAALAMLAVGLLLVAAGLGAPAT